MKKYPRIPCLLVFCCSNVLAMYSSSPFNYRNDDNTVYYAEPVPCAPIADYLPLPEKFLKDSYRDNLYKECENINFIYTQFNDAIKTTEKVSSIISLKHFEKIFSGNRLKYPGYSYRFGKNKPTEEENIRLLPVPSRKNMHLYRKFFMLCLMFARYSNINKCIGEYIDGIAYIAETNRRIKQRDEWNIIGKYYEKTEFDISKNELAKILLPLLNNSAETQISPQKQSSSSSSCSLSEAPTSQHRNKPQKALKITCVYDESSSSPEPDESASPEPCASQSSSCNKTLLQLLSPFLNQGK